MKKLLLCLILIISSVISNARDYGNYGGHSFRTFALSAGYSHFNEGHTNTGYYFKNNQIMLSSVVYGVYLDASIGFNEYSKTDDDYFATWGMDFGYLFPINGRNHKKINAYMGPVIGFQRIGGWYRDDYYDYYWDEYYTSTAFFADDTYFNYGGVIGLSFNHLWLQGKMTRTTCGISVGYKF